MPIEISPGVALSIIGGLISLNAFFIWYLFDGLKGDVKSLGDKFEQIRDNSARLVHKHECEVNLTRIHSRIDELDTNQHELSTRLTKVETQMGI